MCGIMKNTSMHIYAFSKFSNMWLKLDNKIDNYLIFNLK